MAGFGSVEPLKPIAKKELPTQLKGVVGIQRGDTTQDVNLSTHNVFGKFDSTNPSHVNTVGNAVRGPELAGGTPNPRWDARLKDLIVHEGGYFSTPKVASKVETPKADVEKIEKPTVADTVANEKPIKEATPAKKAAATSKPAAAAKTERKMLKPGERPAGMKPKSTSKPYWKGNS